jgi:hypothetical protein
MNASRFAVTTMAAGLFCSCDAAIPLPARAAQVEQRQCEGAPTRQEDLRSIQHMTVLKAESKCHVDYCNGVAQVFGVKLVVRPAEPTSTAELERLLRCHGARATLGEIDLSQDPSDPYWLPDSWVDIDVREAGGNFIVSLTGQSVTDNIHILHRATAFASHHASRDTK